MVSDRVVGCEGSKIGNEEQVKEEFERVGFVALLEAEDVVLGARGWVADPGKNDVLPPLGFGLVPDRRV